MPWKQRPWLWQPSWLEQKHQQHVLLPSYQPWLPSWQPWQMQQLQGPKQQRKNQQQKDQRSEQRGVCSFISFQGVTLVQKTFNYFAKVSL